MPSTARHRRFVAHWDKDLDEAGFMIRLK